jgi:endonuclease YncB( thermonuclease family)
MPNFPFQTIAEHLAFGDKPIWVSATDGDTPTIQLPIRMLGMDAPELHYAGATKENPGKYDGALASFLAKSGKQLDAGLRKYLAPRLTDQASTRQIQAGEAAYKHFDEMVKARLDRGLGKNGKPLTPRRLFVMVSRQVFDRYGRLLAYVNASYEKKEREKLPPAKRLTFNLQMIKDGHAVSLLIYPNVPKAADLKLVQTAVHEARIHRKGFWEQGKKTLLPYEFRWIVDTIAGKRQGPDRYCGDITTAKLFMPLQYYRVEAENRLFFFPEHISEALKMGFKLEA